MKMRFSAVLMWLFGFAALVGLSVYLILYQGSPGPLSNPHAQAVSGGFINSCRQCHAEDGLDVGCLECHQEIAKQLDTENGYHAYLAQEGHKVCKTCHPDHLGKAFPLAGALAWQGKDPSAFSHPHVEFKLKDAHEDLTCEACHQEKLKMAFALERFPEQVRENSFLGLQQECIACHEDIHGGEEATRDCLKCHNQNAFKPAVHFNHDDYFPLVGSHATAACTACHEQSVGNAVSGFGAVKGRSCLDCHTSPHYAEPLVAAACTTCHFAEDENWIEGQRGIDAAMHARFGFKLETPHSETACKGCHQAEAAYDIRFKQPARRENQCATCHADPHEGQFVNRSSGCLECHFKDRFVPSKIGPDQHGIFPLNGGHRAVACNQCHIQEEGREGRRFVHTPKSCKECHDNPHGSQFHDQLVVGDCTACHSEDAGSFRIGSYKHEQNEWFFLGKKHQQADCRQCHFGKERDEPIVYQTASMQCSACHVDVHRGQFSLNGQNDCRRCHSSTVNWDAPGFDHERDAAFSLEGSHAQVSCAACHLPVEQPDGRSIIQYKPLTTRCEDCHGFDFQ